MINLGRFSGKGMPNIRIRPVMLDWIFIGVSLAIVILVWILFLINYQQLTAQGNDGFTLAIMNTVITIILVSVPYIPLKWTNFPFRLTEANVWKQYFLLLRVVRISMLELNFLFLSLFLSNLIPEWKVYNAVLQLVIMGVLGITFLIYFFIAYRWR
ncbi:hypothetical protein [Bacteroides sp. 519]|uniref:hypothetical protein n=1 Tax=Bacteroides sp. 519 TaxID=2302937 RepID=UPI0013D25E2F|nr:hypothetical protein [Bacteroides sp. 519]NDV59020.1 hypothetical protein [Bacteroides sp. 519]